MSEKGVSSTAPVEPRVPMLTSTAMSAINKFLEDRERYLTELQDWNRGKTNNNKIPAMTLQSMISKSTLDTLVAFKMSFQEDEQLTDDKILECFANMKGEHVDKSR